MSQTLRRSAACGQQSKNRSSLESGVAPTRNAKSTGNDFRQPGYTAVSLQGAAVRTQIRQLADKYDDIIIDVGRRDTGSLRAALTVSDALLIPMQPRSFDVWAIDQMAELVNEARAINDLKAVTMLNAADPQGQGRDNDEAAKALTGVDGIIYINSPIVRRKVFPNAAASGRSVIEFTPRDVKAIDEMTALTRQLFV